ncbi:MAG TPA: hypothetical protein VK158_05190 [Acidobacteriota bacterium]|nr:hypothetical protein [Acidobacteriota bacterium]
MAKNIRISRTELFTTTLFLIVIFLPFLILLTGHKVDAINRHENDMNSLPKFEIDKINIRDTVLPTIFMNANESIASTDASFNKIISFNQMCIYLLSELKYNLFREPNTQNVIVGENGWFYLGKSNTPLSLKFMNVYNQSPTEINAVVEEFNAIQKFLSGNNVDLLIVIIPDKETIYPEFYPKKYKKIHNFSQTDAFIGTLRNSTNISLLDLRSNLAAYKESSPNYLYYKTNTHWSYTGAKVGHDAILDTLRTKGMNISRNKIFTSEKRTQEPKDLAREIHSINFGKYDSPVLRLTNNSAIKVDTAEFLDKYNISRTQVPESRISDLVQIYNSKYKKESSVLILGDSFSSIIVPWVADSFNTTIFIWNTNIPINLIEDYKPDVVIFAITERRIDLLKNLDWNLDKSHVTKVTG